MLGFQLIKIIPQETNTSAIMITTPTSSPKINQPRITPNTGARKPKLAISLAV